MTVPVLTAPTLALVAAQAGVSPITVSRVVRTPGKVATETRERVQAAMQSLGYVPNLLAGSLASARSGMIGVLVPTIANAIFADTVQGLSDAMEALGYAVMLAQSRYDPAQEERVLTALLARRPEALMMVGSPATLRGAEMLRRARIPVVETWELPGQPIDAAVGFDNHAAGAAVARHFHHQGRRRLAYVGGEDARATRRWEGFRDAAVAGGLALPERLILERNAAAGRAATAALADADAMFASNDALALGLLAGLRTSRPRRHVPQDVAVVGLGDLELGRLADTPLSTIRIDGGAIGREAARLMLNPGGERRVDLGFKLVVRKSG
jgi:LacI family transcriptional regulator, gluconate utilization system Gnt-I transcriptional repressor